VFQGKTVIVTGGSSGLGRALARKLAARGATLALIARNRTALDSVRAELRGPAADPTRVEVFPCDVSANAAVEAVFGAIETALGLPDVLINSAGILREGYFERQTLETFRQVMDVNFFGTLHCIRAALPLFKRKGEGRIVNVSSMAGLTGVFGYAAYCASKHAVAGLSGTLRAELKPQNIRVHLVCPPEFDSPMVDGIHADRTPENRKVVGTLPTLSAEAVADEILAGIEKERYEIVPGAAARLARRVDRWVPSLGRRLSDHLLGKCYRGPDS